MLRIKDNSCLIVVDVQNDFCPGGALGVNEGNQVVKALNVWIREFSQQGMPQSILRTGIRKIIFPLRQMAESGRLTVFKKLGVPSFLSLLVQGRICRKGFVRDREAYSGFDGKLDGPDGPSLTNGSQSRSCSNLRRGLATDYCVKATVLDGLKHGYEVIVLKDGIRAVDVDQGDGQRAISQMADEGAIII